MQPDHPPFEGIFLHDFEVRTYHHDLVTVAPIAFASVITARVERPPHPRSGCSNHHDDKGESGT
jgi:hypothetical protein